MSEVAQLPAATQTKREELMTCLFRDLQSARYNELYYQMRASTMKSWSNGAKALAALASCAALSGLLQAVPMGTKAMQVLTVIAALAATAELIWHWDTQATQFEKAVFSNNFLRQRITVLLRDLKMSDLEATHEARARELQAFDASLTALNDHGVSQVKDAAWKQTLEEYPVERAWDL